MDLSISISWAEYAQALAGFFAVVNPFSTIPTFIGLTKGYSNSERRNVVLVTAFSTFVILLVAFLIGGQILRFFNISIPSFRIAGGILILMTAFSMLNARQSPTKQTDEEVSERHKRDDNIGVMPLAMPLLAGPGSISMLIIASDHSRTPGDYLFVIAGVLLVAISIFIILRAGVGIAKALGKTGMNVMTRMMGLILAAIAIEFIVAGLSEKFPGWLL